MGERQEIEVLAICTRCGGMSPACHACKGSGYESVTLTVVTDSLTEARLRLADAAEAAEESARLCRNALSDAEYDAADKAFNSTEDAYQAALEVLAALRTKRAGG